jgi:hypothetical protein
VRGEESDRIRGAEADLRALAATLEERGITPVPGARSRRTRTRGGWFGRRRPAGSAEAVGEQPLRFRQTRHSAWPVRSDGTSSELALDSSGRLRVTRLLETGEEPAPFRPGFVLEGHGPGVKFLEWPGTFPRLHEAPDGSILVAVDQAGWGYLFTDEIPLHRLITQTLAAYTRDPRWPCHPSPTQ